MYAHLRMQKEFSCFFCSLRCNVQVFYKLFYCCTILIDNKITPCTFNNDNQSFWVHRLIAFKKLNVVCCVLMQYWVHVLIPMFYLKLNICFIRNTLFTHCFFFHNDNNCSRQWRIWKEHGINYTLILAVTMYNCDILIKLI